MILATMPSDFDHFLDDHFEQFDNRSNLTIGINGEIKYMTSIQTIWVNSTEMIRFDQDDEFLVLYVVILM